LKGFKIELGRYVLIFSGVNEISVCEA